MNEDLIVTLADHRPDFLPYQNDSFLENYGGQFEFLPLNNAFDSTRRELNSRMIRKLGLSEHQIQRSPRVLSRHLRPAFRGGKYIDPAMACAYGMEWFFLAKKEIWRDKNLMFIDSDMFWIGDDTIDSVLDDREVAFIPNFRGPQGAVGYPYAGIFIARKGWQSKGLNWYPGRVGSTPTDVGGQSHGWFEKVEHENRWRELIMLSIREVETGTGSLKIWSQLNGNFNFEFSASASGEISIVKSDDASEIAPFWSSQDVETQLKFWAGHVLRLFEKVSDFGWPRPHYFDFIGSREADRFSPFVFHYKSGSNYQDWATEDYNSRKTNALARLLKSKIDFCA